MNEPQQSNSSRSQPKIDSGYPPKPRVMVVDCPDYQTETVDQSIQQLLDAYGGIHRWVKPGDQVFIKINLLMKKLPEAATTTHPCIVEAIVKKVQAAGGKVTVGDSPGGPYTKSLLDAVYRASGMTEIAKRTGCTLNYDLGSQKVNCDGRIVKALELINPYLEADKVISIGKLKTHMMMRYTGAVKLHFGLIPGLKKAEYHLRMPDPRDFSELLVDIFECTRPHLIILDAVVGMEGDGPSSGTPKFVGCLLASEQGHALDLVGSAIMGIKPSEIPTLQRAQERGLISANLADIEIKGETLTKYQSQFKDPKVKGVNFTGPRVPKSVKTLINRYLQPRPVFIPDKCLGCKVCETVCPAQTVKVVNKRADFDLDKCIRCFCCHELCPHQAIRIKKPWVNQLLTRY